MRKALAKKIGYPLQDLIKHTAILKTRNFLMESQYWDEDKIKKYQLNKIQKLVHHAYINVPYYNKLFNLSIVAQCWYYTRA